MGDVAGHGVAAAAQAGQLRHSLRVYAHEGFGLGRVRCGGSTSCVTQTELTDMATMCIVAIDHDRGRGAHGPRRASAAAAAPGRRRGRGSPTATPTSCSA